MNRTESENVAKAKVAEAKAVIAGKQIESQLLLDLVKELKKNRAFGVARKALERHQADYLNNPNTRPRSDH